MKVLKRIGMYLLAVILLLNVCILFSGNLYIYKTVSNTILKGRLGPSSDEYAIFSNREIKTATEQKWSIAKSYNKYNIPANTKTQFELYKPIAFLVIQNDSIQYEEYWDTYSEHSVTNSFSMAKSFVSILVGCAIDEGKIKSVDQAVGDFIPQYNEGNNKKVTIQHLLNMSSGINFDEDYINPLAYPTRGLYGDDITTLTLAYKLTTEPGKKFEYLSGNTELLAFVLKKATGKTLSDYASEKLWKPMGASSNALWSLDHENGTEKAYCCINSNARDFARVAKLYLDSGRWNGKQLVNEQYVLNSIKPADLINKEGNKIDYYGYSWWLLNYKGNSIFYARGILGQYVIAIPDRNMIIVRLGHKRSKEKIGEHPKDLYLYIDEALNMN